MALSFPSGPTPGQQYTDPNGVIYTWNNTVGVWVKPNAVPPASLAEAAAGTLNTVFSSPQTAVPKDASGMTGAAILPSGTTAQRAAIATPTVGMQRFNTDSGYEEVYTGATNGWKSLQFVPSLSPLPANLTLTSTTYNNGVYVCNNLTIPSGVTASTTSYSATFICYGDVVIDGTFTANGCGGFGTAGGEASSGGYGVPASPYGPGSFGGKTRAPLVLVSNTYSPTVASYGSGGWGGAAYSTGGASGGNGGNGGGGILILAYGTITMSATGSLQANGDNATVGGMYSGTCQIVGGNGGSGGCIVLHSYKNMTLAGSFSVTGGNGSNGFDNIGGAGGAAGGSGAGGGYIILECESTLTDTSTKSLNGGSGGTTFGSSSGQLGNTPGASFGGVGGAINYGSPQAGQPGAVAYAGSPI